MTDFSVMYQSGLLATIKAKNFSVTEKGDLIFFDAIFDKQYNTHAISAGKWVDVYPSKEARDD